MTKETLTLDSSVQSENDFYPRREDRPTANQAGKLMATRPPIAELSTSLSRGGHYTETAGPISSSSFIDAAVVMHSNSLEN